MPNFRRYYIPNSLIFITCVTNNRLPYFQKSIAINLFWNTARKVQRSTPYRLLAHVLLPDHFHWLIKVPDEDGNFSPVLQQFKRNFTNDYKRLFQVQGTLNIWQARFWDHVIKSEIDLENHIAYIHWNPVKHGYTTDPASWGQSSFLHWVKNGFYPPEWGIGDEPAQIAGMDFE